jgi:hypothetical protein
MCNRLLIMSLGVLFVCAPSVRAQFIDQVLNDNPVGFWVLDDATTTATDSTSNNFDGTYTSGATPQGTAGPSWVPGSGLVANFDGSGNITFPDPLDLGINGFTIQAWIKPTLASLQNPTRIVASGRGNDGYGFGTTGSGELVFTAFSQQDYITTGVNLLPNQWYYVGVVFDTNNDARFYVNGALVDFVTGNTGVETPQQDFTIGSRSPLPDEFFTGGLAGISVYSTTLTSGQIQAQYDAAAVPEPSSFALISLAAFGAGCVFLHRRRKIGSPVSN